ncbi:MAG: GC-type dockerin domain-anchored protein [Phycisphaerales bacterium]
MISVMVVVALSFSHTPAIPTIVAVSPPSTDSPNCYANCDDSTIVPWLNANDFICFLNRFAAGESRANCDQSSNPPVLNVNDFICFNESFAAGCSVP